MIAEANRKSEEQAARVASLEASVALLDEQGRKMKAERDILRDELSKACADAERTIGRNYELLDAIAKHVAEKHQLAAERDKARAHVAALLKEIENFAVATSMMDPGRSGDLDGPNAILFLQMGAIWIQGHVDELDQARVAGEAATKSAARMRPVVEAAMTLKRQGGLPLSGDGARLGVAIEEFARGTP
jgi:cell division protein FtsB